MKKLTNYKIMADEIASEVWQNMKKERIRRMYPPDKPTTSGDLTPPKAYYGNNPIEIKFKKTEGEE